MLTTAVVERRDYFKIHLIFCNTIKKLCFDLYMIILIKCGFTFTCKLNMYYSKTTDSTKEKNIKFMLKANGKQEC